MLSPLIFHFNNPTFQNVLAQTFLSHGHESSAAKDKICLVIVIEIGQDHSSPFFATKSCVLASNLQKQNSEISNMFSRNREIKFSKDKEKNKIKEVKNLYLQT